MSDYRLPPRTLGRIGVGDLWTDVTSAASGVVNDVTGGNVDTSTGSSAVTDTSTPIEQGTGVSTPIPDNSGNPNFVTPPPGPTGLAAVPVWAWVAGGGLAVFLIYRAVAK